MFLVVFGEDKDAAGERRGQHAADEITPGLGGGLQHEEMHQRDAEQRQPGCVAGGSTDNVAEQ